MKEFFKMMGASALGSLIVGLILIVVFVFMLVAGIAGAFNDIAQQSDKEVNIKDNSILHLKLEEEVLKDYNRGADFDFDFENLGNDKTDLNTILTQIKRAKTDDKIKGIFYEPSFFMAGMASIEEIRNALIDFKQSGKFIIAYGEIYTHKAYYLASVADEIILYPQGVVQLTGLTAEIMFLKGALEKLEMDVTIVRGSNNKFKSAVEPLILDKMSDANREQTQKYLFALWNHWLKGVSQSRSISVEKLNELADSLTIRDAQTALEHKLITKIAYKDEVNELLKSKVAVDKDEDLHLVSISKYNKDKRIARPKFAFKTKKQKNKNKNKPAIALIFAEGDINDGKADKESIGSEWLAEEIKNARTDTSVKAIVMRVNSPGGSALASDVIWREVILAKAAKPVVVSMGNVAASGGYYISCAADKIFALPNTITGSIGVFGVLPNTQRMFKNKLGITFDRVRTNTHSDIGSLNRPMDEFEYKTIQKGVDDIYNDFISKVAAGRNMSKEKVDSIGQGRVWSGTDALQIGLVDELGGLNDAIADAAERAKLKDYELLIMPEKKNFLEQLFADMESDREDAFINHALNAQYAKWIKELKNIKNTLGKKCIQAKLMFDINVE
jgi:protease-4